MLRSNRKHSLVAFKLVLNYKEFTAIFLSRMRLVLDKGAALIELKLADRFHLFVLESNLDKLVL